MLHFYYHCRPTSLIHVGPHAQAPINSLEQARRAAIIPEHHPRIASVSLSRPGGQAGLSIDSVGRMEMSPYQVSRLLKLGNLGAISAHQQRGARMNLTTRIHARKRPSRRPNFGVLRIGSLRPTGTTDVRRADVISGRRNVATVKALYCSALV